MAILKPNERIAMVAKTRAGKSAFAMVLAGTIAMSLANTNWQVWVLDTKNDPNDLVGWRSWGFRNIASAADQATSPLANAFYFKIDSKDANGNDISVVEQAQAIINAAYLRRTVVIVIDEYVSVVQSDRQAGTALKNVFQRGGGNNVGILGLTQEPVYVPRQLLSQATHIFLFSLTYTYDIKWAKNICKTYVPPMQRGDPHGFYYKWVDGPNADWQYYAHQVEWYNELSIRLPKPPQLGPDANTTPIW
jgi:hypothetical protein